MEKENKQFLKMYIFSGLIYSGLMTTYEYSKGEEIDFMKIIFQFVFFGLAMGLAYRYEYKKKMRQQ